MATIENNKLIAEFMGGVLIYPANTNYGVFKFSKEDKHKLTYDIEPSTENGIAQGFLKFHSSWDWLMPVIRKIRSLDPPHGWGYHNAICAALIETDIDTTYKVVVEFIKWYNNEQK